MKTKLLIVLSIILMVSSCKKDAVLVSGYYEINDGVIVSSGDEFLFDFEDYTTESFAELFKSERVSLKRSSI